MDTSFPRLRWLACALLAGMALNARAEGPIDLKQFNRIHVPASADAAEREAAKVLQTGVLALYQVPLQIVEGPPAESAPAILVGRAAVQAGMITAEALEAVKHDGYVLRGTGTRMAAAGYARQGNLYGAWALLRHLGLRVYPRHGSDSGAVEVLTPAPGGKVAPFDISSKPFYEHRDHSTHLDRGRWGGTFREYTLADPKEGANPELFGRDRKPGYTKYTFSRTDYVDWFHTAPYLVPRDLYYETRPEYFAMLSGKRIPPSSYARCQICTTHPEVVQISTTRAMQWMDVQKDRRVFCIVPADAAMCQCPRCLQADPVPIYHSDRELAWVNPIAAAARTKYPDKLILTAAYGGTVKPPVGIKPEPNVVVMYCPWFWNSRAWSEVSLDSPLNITAMKEFLGWVMRFPGQVGVYDYPGDCVFGTAERTKLYAKHGVRVAYYNGPRGSLLHWINSQLLWDPWKDVETLLAEFLAAHYGPAAEPLGEYLRLRRDTIERQAVHVRSVFSAGRGEPAVVEPEVLGRLKQFLVRAKDLAERADRDARPRILVAVIEGLERYLAGVHPVTGDPDARLAPAAYKAELASYLKVWQRLLTDGEGGASKETAKRQASAFLASAAQVGLKLPESAVKEAKRAEDLPGVALDGLDGLLADALAAAPVEVAAKKATVLRFDGPGEAAQWSFSGTQAELAAKPTAGSVPGPGAGELRGVRVLAPLGRLPLTAYGNLKVRAGRFWVERAFDPPIDTTGCFSLGLHVHVTRDVPATIWLDGLHSDVLLHAGEQIVRVDLRNFGSREGFDWRKWSRLQRVGIELWPQDNFWPFPPAEDTQITLLGLEVANRRPAPDRLPRRGKAVWLSQFRANVPHAIAVPREAPGAQTPRPKSSVPDRGGRQLQEAFRTFTENRAVSPIYAIVTSPAASELEMSAARRMQELLARLTGVTLPINPPGLDAGPHVGNVILLGQAAKAAGRVTDLELGYAGSQGFAIHACDGRIAIAGPDAAGTAHGVARFLEDHGARFYDPESPVCAPLCAGLLHELYTVERPFFSERRIAGGWQLRAQRPAAASRPAGAADAAAAAKVAEAIKDAARRGQKSVAPAVLAEADRSALGRYVAAKLLWDPMADATRIIREFAGDSRSDD